MHISIENPSDSDHIEMIGNHFAGDTVLILENDSVALTELTGDELKLVDYTGDIDPAGTFSLPGGKMDKGWNEYALSQGADNDIYLCSTGRKAPLAKASLSVPSIAKASINIALNSLQKRLGDLREMGKGDSQHGVWGRTYYKNLTVKDSDDTDMTVFGLEAGYDRRIGSYDDSANNGMYIGFMAGNTSISGIKGKDSEGGGTGLLAGAYYTWIMENGWFTDFTLRGGQNKLNLTAKFADSSTVKISPERSFIALSAEGGRSYDFRRNGKGWKAEPKAELQFMNAGAADASVENGSGKVKFGGASYITAIASANGSYSFIRKNGMLIEPFGEMSYSQDISGTEKITYGSNTENSDMKGGTIELRLGLNMQMKQDLYWHAAASIESGSKKQSFGIDAGIRYMFGKKSAKK